MLPHQINEWNSLYTELNQITLLDIVRHYNQSQQQNQSDDLRFKINVINVSLDDIHKCLDNLAKLSGFIDRFDLMNLSNQDNSQTELLRIDKFGNIIINGKIENNPTKIGNEILKMSKLYRDNLPINTLDEYINGANFEPVVPEQEPVPVAINENELPF